MSNRKKMDVDEARRLVLNAVEKVAENSDGRIPLSFVIQILRKDRPWNDEPTEQLFLTCWYDLFLTGILSWGFDFGNPGMEFTRLSEHGKKTLCQLSRDPANPKGYMALLDSILPKGTVARSYIEEALKSYNAGCDKATAVMVGAASEAMALSLRDSLMDRMTALGRPVPDNFKGWMLKTVLDTVEAELKPYTKKKEEAGGMPHELAERFSGHWAAFTAQLRIARNEAGHPSSVDPVTRDMVHGNLLIFPEVARLAADLQQWIQSSYS